MSGWSMSIGVILFLVVPNIAQAQDTQQRYELGGLFTYSFLREIGSTRLWCGNGDRRLRRQVRVSRLSCA